MPASLTRSNTSSIHRSPWACLLYTSHGLMSGPATFANLTHRLLVHPVIRENYQFWFFGYPSGRAWTIPASRQRQALKELMQEYNPRGTSREMNNIVMGGHLSLIHI